MHMDMSACMYVSGLVRAIRSVLVRLDPPCSSEGWHQLSSRQDYVVR